MNLAVLLYEDDPNAPDGIPGQWPSQVIEIGESSELPEYLSAEDGWLIMTTQELTEHKTEYQSSYNTWYAAASNPLVNIIKDKILKARDFGIGLIAEYGAENVIAGYTVEQIQDVMERTSRVQSALNTGSLYVALQELAAVELDETLITEEKVTSFRHKIQDYLGLDRT